MTFATVVWLISTALAQEEVCASTYDNDAMLTDLNAVDDHLRQFDLDQARTDLSDIHRNVLCMEQPVDPDGVVRLARQLSLTFFLDQDEAAMRRWGRMAQYVAPDFPWHTDLDEDHPFRDALTQLSAPEIAGPDQALVLPKKGGLFWNGRPVPSVKLPVEMPGFVQVFDKKGELTARWWQDGSAWPEDRLTNGAPLPPEPPKWWVDAAINPEHRAQAALALFEAPSGPIESDAVAVAEPTPPIQPTPPPDAAPSPEADAPSTEADAAEPEASPEPTAPAPVPQPTFTEAEIADAQRDIATGTYVDPFADARRRAIRREVFEKTTTNEAGDSVTIRTEVMTFKRDRSGGEPITYEVYDYWSRDYPEWQGRAPIDRSDADEGYLSDWSDGVPPTGAARSPLVFISAQGATAYCDTFGASLPDPAAAAIGDGLDWEFRRQGDAVVRVNAKGKVKAIEPAQTFDDTGFRCTQPEALEP